MTTRWRDKECFIGCFLNTTLLLTFVIVVLVVVGILRDWAGSDAVIYVCTSVVDGDTIVVRRVGDRRDLRVRLYGVDAPELDQPGGVAAREWLIRAAFDQELRLDLRDRDRYGRFVAVVHPRHGSRNFNLDLVAAGYAFAYAPYLTDMKERGEFLACEIEAMAAGRGLWADGAEPTPPWEHRAGRRRAGRNAAESPK